MSTAAHQRKHRHANIAAGLCSECGKGLDQDRRRCKACSEKQKDIGKRRYRRLTSVGLCRCGKRPAAAGIHCIDCWFKKAASGIAGSVKAAEAIRQLWMKQDGRCAYTGEKLVPGNGASLDHIVPTSRGGSDAVENLQWVSIRVNRMKTDMTHEEFVAMCRLVIDGR